MQPLDQVTIGQLITYGRDLSIAGVILKLGWEARGVVQSVKDFFKDVSTFMHSVEAKLDTLNNNVNIVMANHLFHLDEKLERIAGKTANDKVSEHYAERLAADSIVDSAGSGSPESLQA